MSIDIPARVAFLKKIHLFYGLDDAELQSMAEELDEMPVAKDGIVFKQNAVAESFYMIYGGSVRIVRKQGGKDIQLASLVKNDYFGELAIAARRRRSATVTALEDTMLLILSRDDFTRLFKEHPHLRNNLEVAVRSRQLARKLQVKWLLANEVIYFLARRHALLLIRKLIIPVLIALVLLSVISAGLAIMQSLAITVIAATGLAGIAVWIAWLSIDWSNDYFVVTNERVVSIEKIILLYDSRQEAPLRNILAVDVDTSQLGRILDYGNVVMRTYVGKITFDNVSHPEQAQRMIEEYWERTKQQVAGEAKEAMKDAIRKRLGIPILDRRKADTAAKPQPSRPRGLLAVLQFIGGDALKFRYEQGENVFYRKHWIVLIQQTLMPLAGCVAILGLLFWRLYQLARSPTEAGFQVVDGSVSADTYFLALLIALIPFLGWLIYQVMDWSNDQFEVTPEQIIDIDRKPFGNESRNAAPLDGILSTSYERKGFLGYLFNFGTVYIVVGGAKLAFEDVMDPGTVQADIDRRRTDRKTKQDESKVAVERERMAEWLATYHHNAEEFRKAEEAKGKPQNGSA